MRKLIILILAAALIVGAFAACGNDIAQSAQENTTAPISTDSASQTSEESPSRQKEDVPDNVIYGYGDALDEWVPSAGECNLSGGVTQALRNDTNDGAYLYVRLSIHDESHQDFYETFTFEGKTREEWRASIRDLSREYNDGYREYNLVESEKINWEEVETTKQKEGIYNAIRAAWDEIWNETHDIHPPTYGLRFYVASETAKSERGKALVVAEYERLTAYGLNVLVRMGTRQDDYGYVFEYYYLVGYLTTTQIEEFPCGDYGYVIRWADKPDDIDE